jgi:hypothetical protein
MYLKAGQGRLRQAKVPIFKKKNLCATPRKMPAVPLPVFMGLVP